MNIHEHQAKQVLARFGVPTPRGQAAFSVDEAGDVYLVGRLPLHAVTAEEVDRILGSVLQYADESFDRLLEIGFAGSIQKGLLEQSGITVDKRGNVTANEEDYRTSDAKIWAAGDMRRGQSLVVWAIREGRQAARAVDQALMGFSELPR